MNYVTRRFEEVFSPEFQNYISEKNEWELSESDVNLIFRRISEYEQKNHIQFVCFFASYFIIFQLPPQ